MQKYKFPLPKIVTQIQTKLVEIGVFHNYDKYFVFIDKNVENWETEFQKIIDKKFLEGNTIDCIKSEKGRYVLYDLSYAWIDYQSDDLNELFEILNLI